MMWFNKSQILLKALRRSACFMALAIALPTMLSALEPADGFFYGIEMDPVGEASVTALETEPAVVLIFAADQKTADITRQFNAWYNSTSRPKVTVYAIAVEPGDMSRDVLLEAINQRNLQMPIFLARNDMLLGDDFRLVVLNDDQEVERFTTLDVFGVNASLAKLGIAVPAPPPTATPVAVPSPNVATITPADQPVTLDAENSALPDANADPAPAGSIRGGAKGDQVYINPIYGMSVEFPPGWRYQVAAQQDGAVAFAPQGSEMDMRMWAIPAAAVASPQEYVDQTLEALAKKNSTRVNVERKFQITEDGVSGLDVTYNYTRLLDAAMQARGALLYRGRIQVFLDGGTIKAARVAAPSGQFLAFFPLIESFISSFQSTAPEKPVPSAASSI